MQVVNWSEIKGAVGVLFNFRNSEEIPETYTGIIDDTLVYSDCVKNGVVNFAKNIKKNIATYEIKHGIPEYKYDFRRETLVNKVLDELEHLFGDVSRDYVEFQLDNVIDGKSNMIYIVSKYNEITSFIIYTPSKQRRSKRLSNVNHINNSYWCNESYINVICTHPKYKGLGLAKKLINHVNRITRFTSRQDASSVAIMSLHPIDDSVNSLYIHLGFANTGCTKSMVTNNLRI